MKRCKNSDRVLDYIEGLMDNQERVIFEDHFKGCALCRQELSAIKKIYEIMDKDPIVFPKNEFFEEIKNKVRQEEVPVRISIKRFWGILAPVVGVFIFLILFNLRKEQSAEISISVWNLLDDEDLNRLLLDRVVDNKIISEFESVEKDFISIEQSFFEMTSDEKQEFIKVICQRYGKEYL